MSKHNYGAEYENGVVMGGLTLKQAARMAREHGGKIWEGTEETDLDPYSEEFDSKEELRERLRTALRRSAEARHATEEERKRHEDYQRGLIDAGLIPIELLGEWMTEAAVRHEDRGALYTFGMYSLPQQLIEATAQVEFRVPPAGTPGNYAITKLVRYQTEKRKRR